MTDSINQSTPVKDLATQNTLQTKDDSLRARSAESELPPHHLVDDAGVALDNLHNLCRNVLIHVVRDGDAVKAVAIQRHGGVHCLQQGLLVDAGDDEAGFVDGFGALGGGADADGREGVADGCEEAALFREGARVGDDGKGVHLKAVVVMEAKGLVLDDARVQLEAGGLKALAGTGMAGIQDRHIVLLCHLVDSVEQRQEVLLSVDVLLTMSRKQNVLALLQAQLSMDVRSLNLRKVLM